MDTVQRTILEAGEQAVERVKTLSRQPRFEPGDRDRFYTSIYYWLKQREIEQKPYQTDSRVRDAWLRDFVKLEPHWMGVLNSIILIDSNRGWTLTGGRNQVYRYTDILHGVEGGEGWRTLIKKAGLSYHTADMCAVFEVGREGNGGPMRDLFHVDPVRCRLTGNPRFPLEYTPAAGGANGKSQLWAPSDFFRVVSMPSDDETKNGLGFCSTSRVVEILTILYSVLTHDEEKLGARMPQGILLLSGVSEQQWIDSLEARAANLDAANRARYGGVQIFANEVPDQLDATLVALSQLPDGFDRSTFLNQCLYAYALCTGYDPREFWPVSSGSLGTATETEVQHQKATGKGGLDFSLSVQERLQRELPDTLDFQFEQRDDQGAILEATVAQAWADVAKTVYEAGTNAALPSLLPREYALSLMAEHGVIPTEWTEIEEETQSTDTQAADEEVPEIEPEEPASMQAEIEEEEAMENERVRRAIARYPQEPIIRYSWPARRVKVLYNPLAPRRRKHFVMPHMRTGIGRLSVAKSDEVKQAVRPTGDKSGRALWLMRQGHMPERVAVPCPLCGESMTDRYTDHKGLHVCPACGRTFNPRVE